MRGATEEVADDEEGVVCEAGFAVPGGGVRRCERAGGRGAAGGEGRRGEGREGGESDGGRGGKGEGGGGGEGQGEGEGRGREEGRGEGKGKREGEVRGKEGGEGGKEREGKEDVPRTPTTRLPLPMEPWTGGAGVVREGIWLWHRRGHSLEVSWSEIKC